VCFVKQIGRQEVNWPEDCVAIVFAATLALPILFVDVRGREWS